MKDILKSGKYKVNGSIWVEGKGGRFLGPGPVELLELIDETGSISKAAKQMEMSYTKAWEIVNRVNSMTKNPLVITATGGEKGGGSSISPDAKKMIAWYRSLRERFQRFLDEESGRLV